MSKDSTDPRVAGPALPTRRALMTACVGYSIFTLIVTWPLVLHLTSAFAHDAEDPLLSATILWWNAHVLPLTHRWLDGFFFFPAGGALALSDHRLGLGFIASPLLWLGVGPVAAYNLTLLVTYPLTAVAAHVLAFTLTRRHDAAVLCGLAFGFNPFRVEHIPHLELLAAFGMPAALLALHMFLTSRRRAWLGAFAAALVVQGLCATYYLLFFVVFLALWIAWFVRPRDWKAGVAIVAAGAASAIVLSPIAVEFSRVHHRFGLSRPLNEILLYSADLTSIVTGSPLLTLWGWTAPLNGNEARIFPGATIMLVSLVGIFAALSRRRTNERSVVARMLAAVGVAFAAIAIVTAVHGPWRVTLGPVAISATVFFKPLTVALAAFAGSIAASTPMRDAWSARSAFAFYLIAAAVLFLCAMGPQPAFLGHQFLYRPPYAWLMHLPFFDRGLRVPARFAMPAALALSVAAALAFDRVVPRDPRRRSVVFAVLALGVVSDAWVMGMPLAPAPAIWNPARAEGVAAVLELPLGGTGEDVRAMYRSIWHRRPTVNGYSGYSPPHYLPLRAALADRDHTALDAAAAAGPLLIVAETDSEWAAFAREHPGAVPVGEDGRWTFFSLRRAAAPTDPCRGETIPIKAAKDDRGAIPVQTITDGDRLTWWTTGRPQRIGDGVTLDLGRAAHPCAVLLSQRGFEQFFPRALRVTTSIDGQRWTAAFAGRTGGLFVHDALESPADPALPIPLDGAAARFIRLQLDQSTERDWWTITDLVVVGLR